VLQLVILLKAVNEVAMMALLGQGALFVLSGASRDRNPVYALFKIVTSPVMKLARALAPRFVVDQHIGFFAFFLVLVAEILLIWAKVTLALSAAGVRP
jgi:hypothetical protein